MAISKRQRGERLFAAGEQQYVLQALSGRLRHDVDAGLARSVRFGQAHLAGAAAEERLEGGGEMGVDHGEGLFEFLARDLVELGDGLLGIGDGLQQVLALAAQEFESLLALVVFLERHHVHRAHGFDARLHLAVLGVGGGQFVAGQQDGLLGEQVFGLGVQLVDARGCEDARARHRCARGQFPGGCALRAIR